MATISIMNEAESLPSWHSSPTDVQSVRLSQELEEKPGPEIFGQETGTGVLLMHIFRTLQRIEARMEGQDRRLDSVEALSHLGGTEEHTSHASVRDPPELYEARASQNLSSRYKSCLKLPSDERTDALAGGTSPSSQGTPGYLSPDGNNRSAYSVSVYSSDVLNSRLMETQAPEIPQRNELRPSPASSIRAFPYEQMSAREEETVRSNDASVSDVASPENAEKTLSISRFQRASRNTDLAVYVYENWKHGLAAKMRSPKEPRHAEKTGLSRSLSTSAKSAKASLQTSCRSVVGGLPRWKVNLDFPSIPR